MLKKELLAHLRSRRVMRRGKMATTAGQTRGQIIGAVSIRERPAEIEDRAVPGHWEGDLLSGARNSHIATLVERRSRFVMLVRVGGKDSESVVDALVRQVRRLPEGLMASLTWDRGAELETSMQFLHAGDELVVLRLNRLGRSTRNVHNFVHELDQKGASLRILELEVTTAGSMGQMVITILGMVGDMQLEFIEDRQRASIDAAKADGIYTGRKRMSMTTKSAGGSRLAQRKPPLLVS